MGGYIMKKTLAILCLLVVLSGSFNMSASASRYDQLPPVLMKSSIDQFNHLDF